MLAISRPGKEENQDRGSIQIRSFNTDLVSPLVPLSRNLIGNYCTGFSYMNSVHPLKILGEDWGTFVFTL